ncbi:class I SAM-dependent RNA methyltransferase [Brachybacterium saurashtrense]|uniref:Class I SAM-dependent RNA methyltransferase n=1 Tax=Brachybacterium saurashtrense TaxID=556288 RepID=A0A345YM36_9MICO|nr:TRAM domain-containing protein [Brachybacterium saurashtrense]AXK44988.1 class I SAM-dependent RNA methyltransferase [Brachybacterium saurashtrense]RRR21672.1 class I SAM-dependent RNA methyltransferase [Brachybacterium saurashtrense]
MTPEADRLPTGPALGDRLLTLTAGPPAAGGTFVARHEGRVVFVRGTAPGETVTARLLEDPQEQASARFWRAEALDVLEAGVDRVPTVWDEAGVDGVGGAEWAHIALPAQRRIASEVMQDLLRRAGVTSYPTEQVQVEPAPHDADGLGWRTRVRYAVDAEGHVGMRGWRSHEVRPVGEDPLSARAVRELRLGEWTAPAGTEAIDAVAPSAGPASVVLIGRDLDPDAVVIPESWGEADVAVRTGRGMVPLRGDGTVHERVGERLFTVAATGFWQSHRRAAELLTEVVEATLRAPHGGSAWDLYGGVGLFAAVAAAQVGSQGTVVSVEGNRRASQHAEENLADLPQASTATADVTDWVRARRGGVDAVVLDPPRSGAGPELMELLANAVRQRIVYVSCEPSTLARDLSAIEKKGWRVVDLRAFDLFPHTHHIESVAVLEPTPG